MVSVLLGISVFVLLISDTNSMPCGSKDVANGWRILDKHCYLLYSSHLTQDAAKWTCVRTPNKDYFMITVDNPSINDFISRDISNNNDIWIGLESRTQDKLKWRWSDGSPLDMYSDSTEAPITSACVIMRKMNDSMTDWYTAPCTDKRGVVCEKETTTAMCEKEWRIGIYDNTFRCYLITGEDVTMNNMDAANYCWDRGSYLVSINNEQEATFLYININTLTEYWIGLSPFEWSDGTPYQWNNWDEAGPSIDDTCVYMDSSTGEWKSDDCLNKRRFICQQDIGTPDTTVSSDAIYETGATDGFSTSVSGLPITTARGLPLQNTHVTYIAVISVLCIVVVGLVCAMTAMYIYFKRRRRATPKADVTSVYYNDGVQDPKTNLNNEDNNKRLEVDSKTTRSAYEELSTISKSNDQRQAASPYESLKTP